MATDFERAKEMIGALKRFPQSFWQFGSNYDTEQAGVKVKEAASIYEKFIDELESREGEHA